MRVVVCGLAAWLVCFGSASAQYQGMEPVRVSVDELVTAGGMYNERPVIVRGKLDYGDMEDQNHNIFELEGDQALRSVRVGTSPYSSFEDLRFKAGQEVEISGIFFDLDSVMMPERHPVLRYYPGAVRQRALKFDANYFIAVTSSEVITPLESELDPDRPEDEPDIVDPDIDVRDLSDVDLRDLLKNPDPYMGKRIVVTGKFRGNNLYGDLSIRGKRTPRDFVIKVADAAIWVTGRRPRGSDFRLDPKKRRDTGNWLKVVGQPWEYEEKLYLRAEKIELIEDPEDPDLEPVDAFSEEDLELPPPEITFTLPLEGERGIALDTEFHVQFSNDMRRESFNRNVDLLYEDDDGISNPFPNLEVLYDEATRTLTVRPNKALEPGKEVRLILYDAIQDDEGQPIVARPGAEELEPGAAVILTFETAQ